MKEETINKKEFLE